MAKKRPVSSKTAFISRVGVSWLVADAQDRLGAMMLGGVCVAMQDQEWLDLSDAQRAAILEGANHSPLIRALAAYRHGQEEPIAVAWHTATTSHRMAALLFARLPVDLFEAPWEVIPLRNRGAIIHGVQHCSLLLAGVYQAVPWFRGGHVRGVAVVTQQEGLPALLDADAAVAWLGRAFNA
jgi:hypothetical protein